ncbi:MAG: methyltransferase domain-containing protein [Alphaproteobacteria bacterium]|nr:methyltransferase domain-containing protein [Alphaproteobacteria bacterium]
MRTPEETAGEPRYVPALGYHFLTPLYDTAIALMTRETTWRKALVKQIAATPRDVVLDVGCGTGTLAVMLKRTSPYTTVYGIDPDPDVLGRAEIKARDNGTLVHFMKGYGADVAERAAPLRVTKVVSSLVLHQVPLEGKREILANMLAALKPGGEIHIADYGLQRSATMRLLFRQIQHLDGCEGTQPNADGIVPVLMEEIGFDNVREDRVIATPTGSISLYSGRRA